MNDGPVLRVPGFRRLWVGLGLSSLGDWLGLLALTAMANLMVEGYAARNYAIAGVLFLRVVPALVVGPVAGYLADRMDRRTVLVWGDHVRGILFLSIPIVGELWWVFVVTVLVALVNGIGLEQVGTDRALVSRTTLLRVLSGLVSPTPSAQEDR